VALHHLGERRAQCVLASRPHLKDPVKPRKHE
jgi:hypothetical protein